MQYYEISFVLRNITALYYNFIITTLHHESVMIKVENLQLLTKTVC